MKTDLPIACKLTEPAFQERRNNVLRETAKSILEIEELEDGFAYRFPADDVWLTKLNEFIHFERQCCPFLTFKLIIKPDNGPIWLQLTGPVGVKEFLSSLFS